MKPKVFILDVDGVMTDGKFYYSEEGKVYKVFGADDSDALKLLKKFIEIRFISGDSRGFEISKARIQEDMGYSIDLVSTTQRADWILSHYEGSEVIFMGDGIFDHYVFEKVLYSIAPQNSGDLTKEKANFVTSRSGGDRAVAEACLHIMDKFFEAYDPAVKINF